MIGQTSPEPDADDDVNVPPGAAHAADAAMTAPSQPREIGGRDGLDPTRYGDWEKNGRCIDF